MAAAAANSTRPWRWLFLVLETIVVATFLFAILFERFSGMPFEPEFEASSVIVGVAYMAAWLFLLIGSPFFLRSLRGVALAGWMIAFGILVFGLLTPAL